MEHSEKMIVIPIDNQINLNKDVFKNSLVVALKLAKIKAYNENLNLYVKNSYKQDSNILDYIEALFDNQNRILKYSNDFINLVYKSKIDFNLISNQLIKASLMKIQNENEGLYTNQSPIDKKVNKNREIKWITV